ncbi:DnaT-like ssDNA-binding domain-containing protein [Gilvimarinus agarilyticus]|uniref:DnaT-like ssDNA-binding domain-containing protein n=1 Tax=Gilvimarinus agarilyticus TaxID=679259 RepID=UPI0005A11848|nr:DnaT-like ssDNA-binding domain-containing protein [Gilvimarinus agarilyticus]
MTSTLLPEKPLLLSPSLAATIGLEEAIMLSALGELAAPGNATNTVCLNADAAAERLGFWGPDDIQRIAKNLQEKGLIDIISAPFTSSGELRVRFAAGVLSQPVTAPAPPAPTPARRQSNTIGALWQPDAELMAQIAQYNIPDYFIRQQLPEFVTYWRERGEPHHAWGSKFLKHVVRQWREHETGLFKRDQDTTVPADWRPSGDAMQLLVRNAGISQAFVEDAIPEFVLYWRERGDVGRTWNSKFIQHVKRQWARYTSALEHDTAPQRIAADWQPSRDVYDVLKLANIDLDFARKQVPEFVLFWRDSNQLNASWNTKFLQHVKHHWARQHALNAQPTQVHSHAGQQQTTAASTTRDRSLIQDLTDRSWAS